MRRVALAMLVALALTTGCSKHAKPPLAPEPVPVVSWVDEVSPPARATRVFDDAEVWAHTTVPLDGSTVNDTTVFLKIDTQRTPIHVTWDAANQRIRVSPVTALQLGATYTVEVTAKLRSASGAAMGGGYRWQFTLLSLRRFASPGPADHALGESPFAMLSWSGTEASAGKVVYDVFAGVDSAAVAARSDPARARAGSAFWVPDRRWAQDTPTFWSVTARNLTTGESLDGPTWRFGALPEATPVDSFVVPVRYWYWSANYAVNCGASQFRTDFEYVNTGKSAAIRWDLRGLGGALRVAGARVVLGALGTSVGQLPGAVVTTSTSANSFNVCDPDNPSPLRTFASVGTPLASGVLAAPSTMSFSSDALSAHLEACARHPELALYGYTFTSVPSLDWSPPGSTWGSPSRLVLYVYRP